ncbi:MAG: peptidase S41, partial [Acidobacteriota bacterium]
MKRILVVVFLLSFASLWGQTKLLRFPDVSGDRVVFSYGGDIWEASTSGGTATRLTAHPGQELFAKFSPDGRWIAFTGQYDGDEQVYVIPSQGGMPKQLTYYPAHGPLPPRWGYDNQVYGWTPDGTRVLFRSLRDEDAVKTLTALYTVSAEGGLPEKLPMPTSGAGDYSPDGKRLIYSPLFRDFRTWKRYQGGWAQDLYIFDLGSFATTPIAHSVRTERDPMWIGDRIYFVSDRDGKLNLYSCDLSGEDIQELTHYKTWDVRWASSDNEGQIVYELDGELHIYRTADQSDRKLDIVVPNDGLSMRPSYYSAAKNIEDIELSPHGERALFVARGDIFTVPIEKGSTRNLTDSSDAHDKHARWSPDGRKIAFISDRSGEDQVYLIDQDGSSAPEQLTTEFAAMLSAPEWSPDSKKLAFSDKDGKLYILTIADRSVVQVADDEYGGIRDYTWSPDSAWLAFSMGNDNDFRSLYIWSEQDQALKRVSGESFNEWNPSWAPKGDYLYFLSDREFAPQVSTVEWNFATNRMTGIFAYALRKDVANLFPPQSDEVKIKKTEETKSEQETGGEEASSEKKDEPAASKQEPAPVGIDFDGLVDRVIRIPVDFDNIEGLSVTDTYVLYFTTGAFYYGRRPEERPALKIF